jgi:uncharacterized protein YcbK (DUF882 family)
LRIAVVLAAFAIARDAPADPLREPHPCIETSLIATTPPIRVQHWAGALEPVEVESVSTHERASIRLYASDGSVDAKARETFEQIVGSTGEVRPLAVRLEQLVVKAAYHFNRARVLVVSGWRPHAGRHSLGDAVDFKLEGVRPALLAAYLRHLPRAGVGVYTHPRTQFVHLDVREPSYHWIDASPPGVKWPEAHLRDPTMAQRDASWTPEMDLPF